MTFRLVEDHWYSELDAALLSEPKQTSIICPFIKHRVAKHLIERSNPCSMRVITRFSLQDFSDGVSDINALEALIQAGAQVRGIRNLHSKLYIFGRSLVMITSANLTHSALRLNHEYGCTLEDSEAIANSNNYFDQKWVLAKPVGLQELTSWRTLVTESHMEGSNFNKRSTLPDFGADPTTKPFDVELPFSDIRPVRVSEASRAFVKFTGTSDGRWPSNKSVVEAVQHSRSHLVLAYPAKQHPRNVDDGDLMFISRLVKDPDDIMIYGRAIGMKHLDLRDVATGAEIEEHPLRAKWPNYIRVHDPEFINGRLCDCVSLSKLMATFVHNSFTSTFRNYENKAGNLNPRFAYLRKPSVEVTEHATKWINDHLDEAFARFGKISQAALERMT